MSNHDPRWPPTAFGAPPNAPAQSAPSGGAALPPTVASPAFPPAPAPVAPPAPGGYPAPAGQPLASTVPWPQAPAPYYGQPPPQQQPPPAAYDPAAYSQPGAAPHGAFGPPQGAAAGSNPFAAFPAQPNTATSTGGGGVQPAAARGGAYGDRAGEHLRMARGRYSAWTYVVIAFVMQMAAIGGLIGLLAVAIGDGVSDDGDTVDAIGFAAGAVVGGVAAFFAFRDRWRCIESFSSRFCSGVMNLSILYVPLVAFVYANVRWAQKLARK